MYKFIFILLIIMEAIIIYTGLFRPEKTTVNMALSCIMGVCAFLFLILFTYMVVVSWSWRLFQPLLAGVSPVDVSRQFVDADAYNLSVE